MKILGIFQENLAYTYREKDERGIKIWNMQKMRFSKLVMLLSLID